jgi:hypothetical protein
LGRVVSVQIGFLAVCVGDAFSDSERIFAVFTAAFGIDRAVRRRDACGDFDAGDAVVASVMQFTHRCSLGVREAACDTVSAV